MIVFGCGNISSLRLQLIIARHLREIGQQVAFLVWVGDADLDAYRSEIGSVAECHALGTPPPARRPPGGGDEGLILQFRNFHRGAIDHAKARLLSLRPTAVLVSEDCISANLHFMQAAKELRLRIVDVPYGYGFKVDFENDLAIKEMEGRLVRPNGSWEERLRRAAPQWIKTGPFAGATMFPAPYILGLHEAGVRLADPWSVHGGLAQLLVLESERARERYERDGLPPSKIVLAGSPYCDQMFRAVERDAQALAVLRKPRRIDGRTRILVSWLPDYHQGRGHLSEFASYEEMTLSALGQLRDFPDAALTISLHPACRPDTAELLRSQGFELSSEYIIDLIPRHDVYVTSFSSTIRWSLACGKPVLNYDAYGWELADYAAPGFFNSRRLTDIVDRARAMTTDGGYYAAAAEQCARAAEWGMLDGQCCGRIAEMLAPRRSRWLSDVIAPVTRRLGFGPF